MPEERPNTNNRRSIPRDRFHRAQLYPNYERRTATLPSRTWNDIKPVAGPTFVPIDKKLAEIPVQSHPSGDLPRQLPSLPEPSAKPTPQLNSPQTRQVTRQRLPIALAGLAVVAFIIGLGLGISSLRANIQAKTKAESIQHSPSNSASENKPTPTDLNNYQVAPDLPRFLIIPKLQVKARVLSLGVRQDGSLGTPNNIYDTGWFSNSAKPNQSGAMLIDGHVHGPTQPGVFANLSELNSGDQITIVRGDNQTFNYRVVATKAYNSGSVDMASALVPYVTGQKGLNLITCTGDVNPATGQYDQRLVVYAIQQ